MLGDPIRDVAVDVEVLDLTVTVKAGTIFLASMTGNELVVEVLTQVVIGEGVMEAVIGVTDDVLNGLGVPAMNFLRTDRTWDSSSSTVSGGIFSSDLTVVSLPGFSTFFCTKGLRGSERTFGVNRELLCALAFKLLLDGHTLDETGSLTMLTVETDVSTGWGSVDADVLAKDC